LPGPGMPPLALSSGPAKREEAVPKMPPFDTLALSLWFLDMVLKL
jgi:hypothetical protein